MYNSLFGMINTAINTVNESVKFILGQAYVKGLEYYIKILDVYETFFMALIFALYFVAYKLILPFISLYTEGADINYINSYLPIMMVSIKLIDAGRNTCLTTIYSAGTFSDTKNKAIIECVLNLSISIFFVLKIGLIGVLSGTIIALLYRVIDTILYTNHELLHRKATKSFILWIQNILLFAVLSVITHYIDFTVDGYFIWVMKAVVLTVSSILVFIGGAFVFRPNCAKIAFKFIIKK